MSCNFLIHAATTLPRAPRPLVACSNWGWLLLVVAVLAIPAPARAATYYYDTSLTAGLGVGGTNDWTTANIWNTSSSGAAGSNLTWSNGNTAVFNGNGTVGLTVNSPISATGASYAVAIGDGPANGSTVTVNYSGSSTLTIAGGYLGVGWTTAGSGQTATVVLNQSSGTINANGGIEIGRFGTNATYNLSGGTVNNAGILRVGSNSSGTTDPQGTFNITGGTFSGTTALIGNAANTRTATATVTVSGTGQFLASAVTLGGTLGSATSTINLNSGGTIKFNSVTQGVSVGGTNSGTFNFNGGELYARQDNSAFMTGLTRANVRNSGAIINTDGFDVTIAQALLHSNIGGDAATDGGLTKKGAGTLILTGANTYTGGTYVQSGILQAGNVSNNGLPTNGAVNISSGAAFIFSSTAAGINYNGTLSGTGTFQIPVGSRVNSGVQASAGSLAWVVDGSLAATANNAHLTMGSLSGASTGSIGQGGSFTGRILTLGGLNLNSTYSGNIISDLQVVKNGTGTQTFTGASSYTGATTINAGTLSVSDVANNGSNSHLGAGTSLVFGGGTLAFTAAGADATNRVVTINSGGAGFNITNSAGNLSMTGALSGAGALTKTGLGTLTLTSANSYGGGTTLSAGTLQIGDNSTGTLSTGNTSIAANATLRFNTTSYQSGSTYNGNLSGTGDVIIDGGAGTNLMRFNGDNSGFAGTFTVLAGSRSSLHSANAGSTSARFVIDGTLSGQAADGSTYHLGELSGASTGFLGAGGSTTIVNWSIGALNTNSTYQGNIGSTSGGITKVGTGTLTLSGANSYTGATTINAGTLSVSDVANNGSNSHLGAGTSLVFGGGTLAFTAAGADSTNRVVTINSGGATFNVTNSAGNLSMTGALSGASGALTKSGAGTLTLANLSGNTYGGGTLISGGTLVVSNTTNSATGGGGVTIGAAGRLAGAGRITGLVTTSANTASLAPGNSPGTLSLLGGLNAAAGATFYFELGTVSDLIDLGSSIFTGSTAANGLRFHFSDSGGMATGVTYTLLTFGSASGLNYSDLIAISKPGGVTFDENFGVGGWLINGNSLQVQFAVVPEPSTAVLLGLGAAALTLIAVRRRQNAA